MNRDNCKILATAFVVFSVALLLLAGCGDGGQTGVPSTSPAALSDAVMCKSFSPGSGPSNITSVFSQSDPRILCAVKLSDAPSGTRVKAVWLYQNSEKYSETQATQGTTWLSFKVEPRDMGRPVRFAQGDYTVKLYLNNAEKITLQFKVE